MMPKPVKAKIEIARSSGRGLAYIELRDGVRRAAVERILADLGATAIEELTAGLLTAELPLAGNEELEKLAVVTPITLKSTRLA